MDTNNKTPENNEPAPENGKGSKFNFYWIYGLLAVYLLGTMLFMNNGQDAKTIGIDRLTKMLKKGEVQRLVVVNNHAVEVFLTKEALKNDSLHKKAASNPLGFANVGPHYSLTIGNSEHFEDRITKMQADSTVKASIPTPEFENRINWVGPLLNYIVFPLGILALLWFFIFRQMGGPNGPGGQLFNIGKSRATLFDSKENGKVNITFQDVAGLDEAKEEVMEVVDFLRTPKKYTALGAKIPKGVLLVGPPGTGKTLLAKAVAGEAGVPFFTLSGSDFVEMFVGVGASRVRDLFAQARAKAPCIIFIDEIDAIGRTRGRNSMSSNDERENTLNQLLVEMDGFGTDKGIILMAATNRADVLDQALLRPGRFDRQIEIDRPDIVGREQIFTVHLKNVQTASDVTAVALAEMTPGFAGADIANICNEAVLIAARRNKTAADMLDFNFALDRIIGGLEKKNKLIAPEEKNIIAYHEAGHAICGWFLEHAMPLVKVTIVPRGSATLGYAQYLPKDEYITRTEALLDRMCMTLGGRAAESVMFDKISTGALSDLDQVTRMAYAMTAIYGMNERVGHVSFYEMQQQGGGFTKPYSEETSFLIDTECRRVIDEQYERAKALLTEKRHELELLAQELLTKEVLHKADLERLIGPRPGGLKLL